ncbi:MAG: DUF1501 domain-containing protein [Planctomyces sp.]|nr:DUF1501 domain-containing protein [Planctomyces sp.]
MMNSMNRRGFLARAGLSSAVVTLSHMTPSFLQAAAAERRSERILVVLEMAGGNDGLNTVIPWKHDVYRSSRPKLAIPDSKVLPVDRELGFHPALQGFADLLEAGKLAVVQGVGYDNPNRSHFESMDIWHTCQRKEESRTDGWLGRAMESTGGGQGGDPAGLHLGGDKQPFALMSRTLRVPSIRSLDQFKLKGGTDEDFVRRVRVLAGEVRDGGDDLLGFVQQSTSAAIDASQRLEATGKTYQPSLPYPDTDLGQKLKSVAQLITSGLSTGVYYVQIDGFDTHAQQSEAHAGLLRQTGDAVYAFTTDLASHGLGDRVLTMCFSEFGRRVAENASEGTDHGTAGPMFLAGGQVKPGFVGRHPDLTRLQDGDLPHHTDFRQVYATVLERWLECPSESVLKGKFQPVDAIVQAG